MTVIQE